MSAVQNQLAQFDPISLKEMDSVALLNRTDSKFVFSLDQLFSLLQICKNDYRALDINGVRLGNYRTLYFDTQTFDLYNNHHRGMEQRFKVRMREYVESKLFYLEVKFKVKGRTDKKRTKITGITETLNEEQKSYVEKLTKSDKLLIPALWNQFQRMTLVSRAYPERVTIDLNLGFKMPDNKNGYTEYPNLVIAEIKQDNRSRNTSFMKALKALGVRECGMSKYCVGTSMLNTGVKYNNFKERILQIQKLNKKAA
ncbi:MAG: polyphosphate polymerase domain-containing protein [Flavobacteriales bacterium]